MATQSTYVLLVKQDLKRRGRIDRRSFPRQWWLLYLSVIVLFAIGVATYVGITGKITIHYIWNFMPFMLFAVFGVTIRLTIHEWRNGTAGWWLSLPISRKTLVFSKFSAGFIRGVLIILGIYVIVALFGFYIMLLHGHFQLRDFLTFLQPGSRWLVFLIGFSPFMASLGLLYSVIRESRLKPILPIFWFAWGVLWWLVSSVISRQFLTIANGGFTFTASIFYSMFASWIITYAVVRLSAYMLERKLAL